MKAFYRLNPVYEPGVGKPPMYPNTTKTPRLNPVYEPGVGKREITTDSVVRDAS